MQSARADHLTTIEPTSLAFGTPVLITAIHNLYFTRKAQIQALYVGEIDFPVEALEQELYEMLLTTGHLAPSGGNRFRVARLFIEENNTYMNGSECEWKELHGS